MIGVANTMKYGPSDNFVNTLKLFIILSLLLSMIGPSYQYSLKNEITSPWSMTADENLDDESNIFPRSDSSRSENWKSNPNPCEQRLQINQGWNLISFFVEVDEFGDGYDASILAAEINEQAGKNIIMYVVTWDRSSSVFLEFVVASGVGKNFKIDTLEGVYLFSNSISEMEFTIVGDCNNGGALLLSKCWNLVGWNSPNSIGVEQFYDILIEEAGSHIIQAIVNYDGSSLQKEYHQWCPGDDPLFTMEPGHGYWVFSSANCLITDFWMKTNGATPKADAYTSQALEIMENMDISVKIGQMIIARIGTFDQSSTVESFIQDGIVGGILVRKHGGTTDAEEVLNFTNWLQELGNGGDKIPLFMVGDFEGGKIMNYPSIMSQWPNNMGIGATNSTDLAYGFGYGYGTEMAALGFNMAFAPVFDVNTNPDNPIIGPRSIGSDPEMVSELGTNILGGHLESGIISTVKHFPGHGDTSVDSHSGLPILDFNLTRLREIELVPFQSAIDSGVPAIMTAHIAIPALDPTGRPATLSKPILTDLLREEMGFDGVIVTDAIEMKAISTNFGVLEAAKLAIVAGTDILLYAGNNPAILRSYHQFLLDEVASGNITEERVNESVMRILKLKFSYGLFDRYPASSENLTNIRAAVNVNTTGEIANRSVTLVNNTDGLLPLIIGPEEPILVVSPNNLVLPNGNLSLAQYLSEKGYNVSKIVLHHQVTETEKNEVLDKANQSSLIIYASHHYSSYRPTYYGNTQIDLALDLRDFSDDSGIPVILVSVENPYDLRKMPDFPTEIVTYTSSTTSIQALVDTMTGKIEFQGVLPVDLD